MSSKGILPVKDNTQGTRGPTNQHADIEANLKQQQDTAQKAMMEAANKQMKNKDQWGTKD